MADTRHVKTVPKGKNDKSLENQFVVENPFELPNSSTRGLKEGSNILDDGLSYSRSSFDSRSSHGEEEGQGH